MPFVALLSVIFLLVALWVYLCLMVRQSGWRFIAGHLAVQATGLTFVIMSLHSNPISGAGWVLFPPVSWSLLSQSVIDTWAFWRRVFPFAFIIAAPITSLIICFRPLRLWAPSVLIVLASCIGYWRAETVSAAAICATARSQQATSVRRNSILWSIRNAPAAFQFGLHGEAMIDGRRYGWSYGEMDWYLIPETVYANVSPPERPCD